MTIKQHDDQPAVVPVAIEQDQGRLKRWLEDPFASAMLATASVALAVGLVLTGMGTVNLLLS